MNIFFSVPKAIRSVLRFFLGDFRYLSNPHSRIDSKYSFEGKGDFKIFRETLCSNICNEKPILLVFGFKLKIVGSIPFIHKMFQRICVLTIPFWCGLPGFKRKLWTVNTKTSEYIGIYDWRGDENAKSYVLFLTPVLKLFAIRDSLWHNTYKNIKLEDYLEKSKSK